MKPIHRYTECIGHTHKRGNSRYEINEASYVTDETNDKIKELIEQYISGYKSEPPTEGQCARGS